MMLDSATLFLIAADAVLLLHVLWVAFIVLGLVLVVAGHFSGWAWIRNPWFRFCHVIAMAVVVAQSWAGVVCPLTTFEMYLRAKGGGGVYAGAFISHWLGVLLYYEAPLWVFTTCYTLFGAGVLASWIWVRPRRFGKRR